MEELQILIGCCLSFTAGLLLGICPEYGLTD
nr:photosystem I protein M [Pinus tabuliformis var. henryi]